jgi:hypothetical protein
MDIWYSPYRGKHTTKIFTLNRSGLYFIRLKSTKEIVYIGMSLYNLWNALYRHFNTPSDPVYYKDRNKYEVRVILIEDKDQTRELEKKFIRRIKPIHNRDFYDERRKVYKAGRKGIYQVHEDISSELLEGVPF